jgi:CPA1 family monovalent cation:H+ antiporter
LLRRPGAFTSWRPLVAISWAGMRGVVSLAAAQTLPLDTPFRPLLLTCTIAVILGTLVVQGLSLPRVIRALHLPGDPDSDLRQERADARAEASRAINAAVERTISAERLSAEEADRMRAWVTFRDWRRLTERLDRTGLDRSSDDARDRLDRIAQRNRDLVRIERDVFVRMRNSGRISEEVMREVEYGLDLEEALLEQRVDAATGHLDQLRAARADPEDPAPDADAIGPPDRPEIGR